jgi:predicted metal-dependent hydrolase
MSTATVTSTPERSVPTRRISFEESLQQLPKHFAADGDPILSHVAANLSAVFPDGEDFFVRSVRAYRDRIDDPELKQQVKGFIGQEAMHGREHRVFNDRLHELGYPTKRIERFTKWGLALRTKYAPKKANLASTAALEHFTATLAELLLTSQATRDMFGHDEVRNLFLWHALEESEHKAVAFDVYRAVGGTERMRIWTMRFIMIGFIIGMTVQTTLSVLADRDAWRRGRIFKSIWNLRKAPFLRLSIWRQLQEYNKVGFHPDDRDTYPLVEEWRTTLFGEHGTLNDKLTAKPSAA